MTIYKYPIEITDSQAVLIPVDAKLLTVQIQNEKLCLWAMFDEKKHISKLRTIEVFGTGNLIPPGNRVYISTVQDGVFVWHIFERL